MTHIQSKMTGAKHMRPGAVVAAIVLALLAWAPVAHAESAWWQLSSTATPTHLPPGGEGELLLEASNLGDGPVTAEGAPVTISDKLPPGLTVTGISGGPVGNVLSLDVQTQMTCSETAVSCTFEGKLRPYERLEVLVDVKVAPNAAEDLENEVTVTGGNATPLSVRRPLVVSSTPTPFGVDNYELYPANEDGSPATQAGSHPFQLTTTVNLNTKVEPVWWPYGNTFVPEVYPVNLVKDLHFNLPAGLIGNPTPLPECTDAQFSKGLEGVSIPLWNQCPADTAVGVATVVISNGFYQHALPDVITVPLFNLVPSKGEPARFGFTPFVGAVTLDTYLRTGGDYGVVVHVDDVTQYVAFLSSQVTLWGVPGDPRHDASRGTGCMFQSLFGQPILGTTCVPSNEPHPSPFLILPTACTGPLHTSVEADSWAKPGQFAAKEYTFANNRGEPFGMDGCNRLSFEPSISLTPDGQAASTPTGLAVGVHVPQTASLDATGDAESTVKDTTVTLPDGVVLNPAAADGLSACGMSEIGLESAAEQTCPDASKIGTVEIHTPLLPHPLTGAAYLAQQNANPFGSLIAIYLVAKDPFSGVLVKLAGQVTPNPVTGQLVATFDNTPQLPFEELNLHFFGGSRAPLGTPALCGPYTTTASFTPWSGNGSANSASTFEITSGPNNTPCSNPLPFAPELAAGAPSIQAGGFSSFTMTMSRQDGNQNLDAIKLHMPAGLSGMLTGIPLCGEAQANAGLCPAASQIGETTISVGLGGDPFTVSGGKVYITGPYDGAAYGLSIVNPAKAGPFDVEHDTSNPNYQNACDCVVVRAKIEIDPITAAITVTSDTTGPYRIPTIIDGIPLQIKHINVTINRPSFIFNPTNCEKTAITGSLTSSEGAVDGLSVPFQVTNCAVLGFKPQFAVSTSAHHSRTGGESLHVKLSYPKAPFGSQANVAKVRVELPKQLPSRLTTLQKACTDTVFNANPENCPAASKVGEAIATTPIIPEDFRGPAYFVSHGGVKFPELIIALHGYALTVDLHGETFISKEGVTSTTFNTVPDVPIGSFELILPAGPDSALAANGDLCASKLVMPTTFTAQNGARIQQSTPISVQGCSPQIRVIRHTVKGKHATVVVSVPSGGTLTAGGHGLSRVTKTVSKAGTVTVTLRLSKAEQRFVASHHARRLMAPIRLSFTPARGGRMTAQVAVLMR